MSKSAVLGAVLRRLGICALALQARRLGWLRRGELTILCYHRIAPDPPDAFGPADDNISCSAEQFELEVALLRRYFSPVSFAQVAEARRAGRGLPPNPLIVSFDDGYRDNFAVAAPILRRHGVTACFFLTTGFLDGEAVPWWDAINLAMRRAPAGRLRLASLGEEFDLTGAPQRASAAAVVRGRFRSLPPGRYGEVLAELGEASACGLGAGVFRASFMRWEDARALVERGFEIGAHTRTHPVLSQIESPAALDEELAGARAELAERLATPVIALAYPVGTRAAVNAMVIDRARRAGYEFACTFEDGLNRLGRLDCLALRRVAVGTGSADFAVKLAFPFLFRRTNA